MNWMSILTTLIVGFNAFVLVYFVLLNTSKETCPHQVPGHHSEEVAASYTWLKNATTVESETTNSSPD